MFNAVSGIRMTDTGSPEQFMLDEVDRKILDVILKKADLNLKDIADSIGVSKSTVHNRIRRMKDEKYLKGFFPLINHSMLNEQVTAITLIRAKYGPEYSQEVGKKLAEIKGTWGVYFVIGEQDFIVLIRAKNKSELSEIVNKLAQLDGVERSNTIMVLDIFKEDPREAIRID